MPLVLSTLHYPFCDFFFNREFILCCFGELREVLIGVAIKGCI